MSWWNPLAPIAAQLDQVLANQNLMASYLQGIKTMANALDAAITQLQSDVTAQTTVNTSVVTLLQGLSTQLAAALAAAAAAGATPAELSDLAALDTSLQAQTAALAAAVTANTPKP